MGTGSIQKRTRARYGRVFDESAGPKSACRAEADGAFGDGEFPMTIACGAIRTASATSR
jgi:hypothetical protein